MICNTMGVRSVLEGVAGNRTSSSTEAGVIHYRPSTVQAAPGHDGSPLYLTGRSTDRKDIEFVIPNIITTLDKYRIGKVSVTKKYNHDTAILQTIDDLRHTVKVNASFSSNIG